MKLLEIITEATIKQEPPLNSNINDVQPHLLTWEEYLAVANPQDKWHSTDTYDYTLANLNEPWVRNKLKTAKQYVTKLIKGRSFTFYINVEDKRELQYNNVSPAQMDKINNNPYNYEFTVVDDESGNVVGTAQDEWGALLISVAREFRGFNLGVLLGTFIRKYVPAYNSGGLTSGGKHNLYKVYSNAVKDAMANGVYSKLVKARKLSASRATEIINSANLATKLPSSLTPDRTFENNKQDWVCMNDHTSFIIYNSKLLALYNRDAVSDFWKDELIVGMGFASSTAIDNDLVIYQFGGKDDAVKKLIMSLLMTAAQDLGYNVRVEDQFVKYVDMRKVEKSTEKSYSKNELVLKPVNYSTRIPVMIQADQRLRKKYDKHDEFKYWLQETATAKYD